MINLVKVQNITAHNEERRNCLMHAPIEVLFDLFKVPYQCKTLDEYLNSNTNSCLYITSDLCRLSTQTQFESCFDHLISNDVKEAINSKKLKLLIFDTSSLRESSGDSKFLWRLIRYLNSKNLVKEQCNIITNISIDNAPYMLHTWEYFEHAIHLMFENQNINIDLDKKMSEYNCDKNFRFLCLNAKPRFHRYLLMYNFFKECSDFDKQFNYSLRAITIDDLAKNLIRYQREIFSKYIDAKQLFKLWPLLKKLPAYIHEEGQVSNFHLWGRISSLEKSIYNTGINIITETTLTESCRVFFTEKTFRPIAAKMPFIMCGQYGSLKKLKSLGYQTFNKFWDESYDDEKCPEKRIHKITNTVSTISKMTNIQFNDLIKNTKNIINYNYNHYISNRIPNETKKIIDLFA